MTGPAESRKLKGESYSSRHSVLADDHRPFVNAPAGDEAARHVRIAGCEFFNVGGIVDEEDEQRARLRSPLASFVWRARGGFQSSREDEASVTMGLVDQREMCLPVRLPPLGEIVDGVVKEREVRHGDQDLPRKHENT